MAVVLVSLPISSFSDLPRQTIFYDVVDYAYNHRMSPRLRDVIPILLTHPVTQEVQVEHIRTIGKIRFDFTFTYFLFFCVPQTMQR